jgi:hypothetical protein
MISRNLARRLNRLETCFRPIAEPMTIRVVFVDGPNKEITGSLEFQVGAEARSSADGIAPRRIRRSGPDECR